ncbi:MAG: hypothetical protein C0501_22575 [Isosphaera sp.]|nr:hypothetical protein [Isosphaera sp.]
MSTVAVACWQLGGGLYLAAFVLPYGGGTLGYEVFVLGLIYCWLPGAGLPFWWANLLFWYALVAQQKSPRAAAATAVVAAGLGLGWWAMADAGLGPAYWFWAGGMGVAAVGSVAWAAATRPLRP